MGEKGEWREGGDFIPKIRKTRTRFAGNKVSPTHTPAMAASSNGPCTDRRPSDMFSLFGSSDDDHSDCPTNPNDAGSATTRLRVSANLKFAARANGRGGQSPVWSVRSEEKSAVGNVSRRGSTAEGKALGGRGKGMIGR